MIKIGLTLNEGQGQYNKTEYRVHSAVLGTELSRGCSQRHSRTPPPPPPPVTTPAFLPSGERHSRLSVRALYTRSRRSRNQRRQDIQESQEAGHSGITGGRTFRNHRKQDIQESQEAGHSDKFAPLAPGIAGGRID